MEPTNINRAAWARAAVLAFQKACRTDQEDAIADLLCDLMHLCDAMPVYGQFNALLRRAESNYQQEKQDEENTNEI